MAEQATGANPLWVHEERAVITAQNHDISALTPEFLVSSGVIPENWECHRILRTPPAVDIEIGPTRWNMTETNLWIIQVQDCPLPDRQGEDALIPGLAHKFLEATPYSPSHSLHFAWGISALHADPARWLARNFFNRSWAAGFEVITPTPIVDVLTEGITLQIAVSNFLAHRGSGSILPSLLFNCMATRGINQTVGQMIEETNNWGEWLEIAARAVSLMLDAEG